MRHDRGEEGVSRTTQVTNPRASADEGAHALTDGRRGGPGAEKADGEAISLHL
jgi:hypothetical protein